MLIHVVRPGESIWSVALEYGVPPGLLAQTNGVGAGETLVVGQALAVRFPTQVHVVRGGETLYGIAARYGVSEKALLRRNYGLGGRGTLYPGELLAISYLDQPLRAAAINGYAYPQIEKTLLNTLLPYLSWLTPFTYGIAADGALLPPEDEALLEAAKRAGVAPLLHLSTLTEQGSFDSGRAALVLQNGEIQRALLQSVAQTVQQKGYRGADVDFEYVPASLREAYAAFVTALRTRLAPLPVLTALAPKTRADQPGLLYEAHDYALLGAAADAALLMTYEWGYTYGPPMAVAPLPQVRQVLDYAVSAIAPEKLLLGLSAYGYDWPLPYRQGETRAQSLSPQQALALARQYGAQVRYDETAQAPYFPYRDAQGREHEVWFEDARSALSRLRLIDEYGLRGAGVWSLRRAFPQLWAVLDALYTAP